MSANPPSRLERIFRFVLRARWWIVAAYALLLPPSVGFALRVEQDDAIERLVVQSDPELITAQEFEAVFGGSEFVLLLAEAPDPFAPEILRGLDDLERTIDAVDRVEASSVLSLWRRAHPGFEVSPDRAGELRRFATGTELFRKQGLVGDRFLAIAVGLDARSADERNHLLGELDRETDRFARGLPSVVLRKVGGPYVNRYLERETASAVRKYFPLFGSFLIAINLALYRSLRTLLAFGATTLTAMALTVGYVGATGGVLTIVSSLVPMTVLITCTSTLVYIHSRFIERPEGVSVEDHQVFALANKFLPCTASVVATLAGFAALSVSKIRPIRELGIWTAVGLGLVWLAAFTLFPALQRILRTPTRTPSRQAADGLFRRMADRLPGWTYRRRFPLVAGSLLACVGGAVAIVGVPGLLPPMRLETDALEYVNPRSAVYRDIKALEGALAGLSVTELWLRGAPGTVTDPAVLRGLDRFSLELEQDERIGTVIGPTTALRTMRYAAGQGDLLPEDAGGLEQLAGDLETLLPTEPALQRFVEQKTLSQARLTVVTRGRTFPGSGQLEQFLRDRWEEAGRRDPALAAFTIVPTGPGPLERKIADNLVPTLVESFALTVGIVFLTFFVVFRSGAARMMAMIPSLFAILVMFAVMRVGGVALNVATILIATTVLGASENDQIHFFYHFLEGRRGGSTERSLRHTLFVSGKAIAFATLINAGGFLAFALSDLPPMRHFGALTALAFLLSMIADFTALPAALWIVFRQRPDRLSGSAEGRGE